MVHNDEEFETETDIGLSIFVKYSKDQEKLENNKKNYTTFDYNFNSYHEQCII